VSPEGSLRLVGLWSSAAVALAAYLALFFLAHRPVTLRLRRLGGLALVIAGVRLTLVPLGDSLANRTDIGLTGIALLGGVGLWLGGRVWLVRGETAVLREEVRMACDGLFLECAEPRAGLFVFTTKVGTWRLRLLALSRRMQLVVLPRVDVPSKVALLVQWLSKQYPGPVPRLHIVLRKE